MTRSELDLLDEALSSSRPDAAMSHEVGALVDIAAEVRTALAAWRLTAARRAELQVRALQLAEQNRNARQPRLRRWRRPALLGGGVVTLGAAAAITVALVRGRHARQPATV